MRDADNQKTYAMAGARRDASHARTLRGWIAVLCATQVSLALAAAPSLTGRRVADVLDGLRGQGLTFIYNSDLLPRQLLVSEEPSASRGLDLARDVLAGHGLSVAAVVPGVYAV